MKAILNIAALALGAITLYIAIAVTISVRAHTSERCQVIGHSSEGGVPPDDKLWFKEQCSCKEAGRVEMDFSVSPPVLRPVFVCALRE